MYEVLGELSISEQSRLSIAFFRRAIRLLEPNGWISPDVSISSARGEGLFFKVWRKDLWVYSAKLSLAYRLVWHYWFLDDTRRVRQIFHIHREAHRPQIWFDTIPASTADSCSKHQSCGLVSRGISLQSVTLSMRVKTHC